MRVEAHESVEHFLSRSQSLLLADEARHNLILGICSTLVTAPSVYPVFHLWTVERDGKCVAAAAMTPPFNLALARPSVPAALEALANYLWDEGVVPPGVTGALPEVDELAIAWETATGRRAQIRKRQGIYRVRSPRLPRSVDGRLRPANAEDRELLVDWMRAFIDEAGADHVDPREFVDRRLDGPGGLVVWEREQPVSFAGFGNETPTGIRIGPVFTPASLRRNGYASALVAALSEQLLDEGRDSCFLYTDLANPTANHIYLDVGYELVAESAEYAFQDHE
ncbi:MAG TPA: GNAT family N-acetyltransferase [Gaiellaceae bacterium]